MRKTVRRSRSFLSLKQNGDDASFPSSSTPTSFLFLPSQKPPADATLVDEGEGGFRVSTVGAPHVTGCATAHEPGGATGGDEGKGKGGGNRATACSFALDVKGALRAVLASSTEGGEEEASEIDGAFHVARIVSDAEFEGGIGPLNVEVSLDEEAKGEGAAPRASSAPSSEAAIESARAEIARRVVKAVSSVIEASSESPRKGGEGEKEKDKEKEEMGKVGEGEKEKKEEVQVGGEAA